MTTTDRRTFLALAPSLAAGLAVESARGYQANDTLRVGLIGVGGRCRHLVQSFPKIPNVAITAVCDVWDAQPRGRQETRRFRTPSPPSTTRNCSPARTWTPS